MVHVASALLLQLGLLPAYRTVQSVYNKMSLKVLDVETSSPFPPLITESMEVCTSCTDEFCNGFFSTAYLLQSQSLVSSTTPTPSSLVLEINTVPGDPIKPSLVLTLPNDPRGQRIVRPLVFTDRAVDGLKFTVRGIIQQPSTTSGMPPRDEPTYPPSKRIHTIDTPPHPSTCLPTPPQGQMDDLDDIDFQAMLEGVFPLEDIIHMSSGAVDGDG